jgi:hypothetical protein
VTESVRFFVLLSLYVPVAVICCVLPSVIEGVWGVTATLESVGFTMNPLQPGK